MAELVNGIRMYKYSNAYAFLTDGDGNLIFHPKINLAALDEVQAEVSMMSAASAAISSSCRG